MSSVKVDPLRKNQLPRVLFLRSNCQSTFAAFLVSGLECSPYIEFEQFPPVPQEEWRKIEKTYDPEEGLANFNRHLIANHHELQNKLRDGYYDLVLLLDYDGRLFSYQQMGLLKKWRNILGQFKKIFHRRPAEIMQHLRLMQGLSLSLAEINAMVPVAVVDLDDWICLPPEGQDLLRHCSYYYKRELPFNRFFLYYQQRPAPWRVWRKKLAPICAKTRNIPLGIEDKKYYALKAKRKREQDIDIFYCGLPTSTPRLTALNQLKKIAATTDWHIVIADSLPFAEYSEKISRSKITLSISGGGWDCFRHYEAIALGSVPLMDTPVVDAQWWQQLPNGLFFANCFTDFQDRIESLLSDPSLLKNCFDELEQAVESHMLHSKIVEHIVHDALKE